jgi:hypothetical protein
MRLVKRKITQRETNNILIIPERSIGEDTQILVVPMEEYYAFGENVRVIGSVNINFSIANSRTIPFYQDTVLMRVLLGNDLQEMLIAPRYFREIE